jgi:hypothetical protein
MIRRLALVALPLALVAGALTACTESTRIPPAEPTADVAPLFATDEEALAAATAAYEEYLAVLDGMLQDPREVTVEFDEVAEGAALDAAVISVAEFVDQGFSISGPRRIGRVDLQQASISTDMAEVTAYFCEDISGVQLRDKEGQSVSTEDRPDFTLFEATIRIDAIGAVVIEREFWSNEVSC